VKVLSFSAQLIWQQITNTSIGTDTVVKRVGETGDLSTGVNRDNRGYKGILPEDFRIGGEERLLVGADYT